MGTREPMGVYAFLTAYFMLYYDTGVLYYSEINILEQAADKAL